MLLESSFQIDKANNVIIVGGGAVGIELAGEIADKYSAKMITIIHSNTSLVILIPSYYM